MKFLVLFLITITSACYSQQDEYRAKLSECVKEIGELDYFSNDVVMHDDRGGVKWEAKMDYYEGDLVQFRKSSYEAIANSRGKSPHESPNEWAQIWGPHPYLFLKYHAKTEDLMKLVKANQPLIRTYAFTVLVYRKQDGLFNIVLDNLNNTTRIDQFFGDSGYSASPADIMLFYSLKNFNRDQKDSLKELILYKYNHLNAMDDVMLFHKPLDKDYLQIRKVATSKRQNAFGLANAFDLIALAKYRKQEDINLIMTGFDNIQYYNGVKLFFKAIEEFPSPAFKQKLLTYGEQFEKIDLNTRLRGEEYFLSSLAAFHDVECFNLLSKITDHLILLKNDEVKFGDSKIENLQIVYNALERHPDLMYTDLMKMIEKQIREKEALLRSGYEMENSIWDY